MRSSPSPSPLRHDAGPARIERVPTLLVRRRSGGGGSKRIASRGFTIVEVMMAATILVIGFVGMIEAVTLSAGMMDHARRQAFASQIINQEIEKLRFASWTTINALPTASTAVAIDYPLWPAWNSAVNYTANRVVSYNGNSYRCIQAPTANQVPTNTTYWTATVTPATTDVIVVQGATYTLARTVNTSNPVTNIREVTFTVTWVVTTSRLNAGSTVTFTYSRSNSAWFGKYGLNLSYQRS